ncbi:hypothetical protein MFLO_12151 [Listeria floridensis FSL S10-1187]|uniref:Flagellar FliJ protein n=1 Tax=Listeria floridensis FSL S10-1187 TaxID=1265817 RepID=A0ABP3AVT2_9LIST|nr:hypothetical protein [Listeria floridensis]EUJ28496.1 hypothetical protein MFLO_12151 [Listeria floridensis FSL S10-1187]
MGLDLHFEKLQNLKKIEEDLLEQESTNKRSEEAFEELIYQQRRIFLEMKEIWKTGSMALFIADNEISLQRQQNRMFEAWDIEREQGSRQKASCIEKQEMLLRQVKEGES